MMMVLSVLAQPSHYITFNGTDQYMRIPHHEDFNIAANESFTLTGWVRNETYTSNPRYVCKRDMSVTSAGDERSGYEFFGTSSTGQSLGLNTPTSTTGHALSLFTGVTVGAGEWMHFALVVDRGNDEIRIYHNGQTNSAWVASVGDWEVTNTHDLLVAVGNNGGVPAYYCNGSFGNVRFYDMALNVSEMAVDMNNDDINDLTSTMRDHLLAAYDFTMEQVVDNQLLDLVGNHDADLVNFVFGAANILEVTLEQDTRLTGRGNPNEILLKVGVAYGGDNNSVDLRSMRLNLEGTTDLDDIDVIKVYSTGIVGTFDWRTLEGAELIGSVVPVSGELVCDLAGQLVTGYNYLWITVGINDHAVEGHVVDASLLAIQTADEYYELDYPSPEGNREIIRACATLYRPGDYSSANYRIPAVITAKDGSVVAVNDKRKNNEGDLPEDIDIVCRRSTDGGHTWSEPVTIAEGTGYGQGFGDCALVWSNDDDGLIAGFVGGPGLWYSTPSVPIRTYIARSYDNGQTWTEPEDITHFIFGDNCVVPEQCTWRASFFGSGNGLRTSSGRIMFVAAIRETTAQVLYNHAVYSDDNGLTWHVSGRASTSGDEAKVTELVDGRILMSIRHSGKRRYNISEDGGETWRPTTSNWNDLIAPACNGDMIRYTSVNQGDDCNRLLHSLPYGTNREKVTVYVSYDEGETWPVSKCVVPYGSAYSSLCVLPDGTIGLYVEEAYHGEAGYSMVFYNFSLAWLTDGNDIYDPTSVHESQVGQAFLKVYPVPSASLVFIESMDAEVIHIYGLDGKRIASVPANGDNRVAIDVSGLASGVYFIESIDNQGNKKIGRFIKGN